LPRDIASYKRPLFSAVFSSCLRLCAACPQTSLSADRK